MIILFYFFDLNGLIEWILKYISNISGILQGLAAVVVVITFIITIIQLRLENKKRDIEIRSLVKQTDRLQKLLEHEINIRRNSIRPRFYKASSSHNMDGFIFGFNNKGKRAYDLSTEIIEFSDELELIGKTSETKILEKGQDIKIQFKRKDNKSDPKYLKDTIIRMDVTFFDEDENKYQQTADIISGKSTISKPEIVEEEI